MNKKPKRIVKHKKKAWRAAPVDDVERYLESQRLDERLGAPFNERPSESLFIVDNSKEDESKPAQPKRRKLKEIGPLRCYEILIPNSAVPDPLKSRNRVRTPQERGDPLLKKIEEERRAKGKIPIRFLNSMKDHQKNVEKLAEKPKPERLRSNFDFDMWGDKGDYIMIGDKRVVVTDLSDTVKQYTMEKTGKRVYSRPKSMFNKTTALPPIEFPHPGTSYNPTFEDHQALIKDAYQVEVKEIKQEAHVRRQLGPMMKKIPVKEKEENWMTEMSQGLADDDDVEANNNEEQILVRPTKPKTRRQKIKAKVIKMRNFRLKRYKDSMKRLNAVNRLRKINRELEEYEKQLAQDALKRQKEKKAKMLKPRILGRHKYEAPAVEVNLSDEIAGTLRGLKTEGHVLIDRYKSLQRRNIIEPRIRQRVTLRYTPKKYTKRSHQEPTGYKVNGKKA
nr:EOG090X07H9 [Polyphemus pediculus]